jgi:hypothetical protein
MSLRRPASASTLDARRPASAAATATVEMRQRRESIRLLALEAAYAPAEAYERYQQAVSCEVHFMSTPLASRVHSVPCVVSDAHSPAAPSLGVCPPQSPLVRRGSQSGSLKTVAIGGDGRGRESSGGGAPSAHLAPRRSITIEDLMLGTASMLPKASRGGAGAKGAAPVLSCEHTISSATADANMLRRRSTVRRGGVNEMTSAAARSAAAARRMTQRRMTPPAVGAHAGLRGLNGAQSRRRLSTMYRHAPPNSDRMYSLWRDAASRVLVLRRASGWLPLVLLH